MSTTQSILKVAQRDEGQDKEAHIRAAGDLSGVKVMHNQLLVAGFIGREKVGSILRPQKRIDEDKYQMKIGLVMKKGPMAFVSDTINDFGDQNVEIGEWVAFKGSDGWELTLNNYIFRVLEDSHIKLVLSSPSLVTEY